MKYQKCNALFLAIVTLSCMQSQIVLAQVGPQANRKAETSKANEFEPTTLNKVAILVAGSDQKTPKYRPGKTAQADTLTDQQRLVEDVFLESLLAKGHTVVARSDVQSVFKEKGFQASGLTEELAANVGKFLNVPAVLVVRITEVSTEQSPASKFLIGRVSLGARLINVETGAILWNGTHNDSSAVNSQGACSAMLLTTAAALAEAFPEKTPAFDPTSAKPINPKEFPKLAVIMAAGDPHTRTIGRIGAQAEIQSDHQRRVEDAFINVLTAKGYRLVSRSDMQAVAKEQQFQKSGFTEDNAVAAGKILNVPAVMMVRITDFAVEPFQGPAMKGKIGALPATGVNVARVSMGARLVDVNRGEIMWAHGGFASLQVRTKGEGNDVLDSLAKDVANFFPPADSKKVQMTQAEKLANMGQITASIASFRAVIRNNPGTPEAKKAEAWLKALGGKK